MGRLFVEPARVPEYFVSGTAYIDDLKDGNHRFAMFANVAGEQIIRVKLIIAAPNIYLQMHQTMLHLGYKCCGGQRTRAGMN